jgi:hypothetical protein
MIQNDWKKEKKGMGHRGDKRPLRALTSAGAASLGVKIDIKNKSK